MVFDGITCMVVPVSPGLRWLQMVCPGQFLVSRGQSYSLPVNPGQSLSVRVCSSLSRSVQVPDGLI